MVGGSLGWEDSCHAPALGAIVFLVLSGTDLASKQDIGLLNATSCDQPFREFSKGSTDGGDNARVSAFAHVAAP